MGAKLTANQRALGLLAVRPRSVKEIRDRLSRAGFDAVEVEDVILRLEKTRLLDDEDFARQFAEQAVGRKKVGKRSLANSLRLKGISTSTIESVVAEAGDEEERAEELALTRLSRLKGLEREAAYRRLSGFLMRRGYDGAVAHRVTGRVLALDPLE